MFVVEDYLLQLALVPFHLESRCTPRNNSAANTNTDGTVHLTDWSPGLQNHGLCWDSRIV